MCMCVYVCLCVHACVYVLCMFVWLSVGGEYGGEYCGICCVSWFAGGTINTMPFTFEKIRYKKEEVRLRGVRSGAFV